MFRPKRVHKEHAFGIQYCNADTDTDIY